MLDHDQRLVQIREILSGVLTPNVAEAWLREPNLRLGGRSPLDAVRTGDGELVWVLAVAIAADHNG